MYADVIIKHYVPRSVHNVLCLDPKHFLDLGFIFWIRSAVQITNDRNEVESTPTANNQRKTAHLF